MKKDKKDIHNKGNNLLYGFLIFVISGYVIFFSSKLWLKAPYEGVEVTPVGKTITNEDRAVTIDSWKYSKNEKRWRLWLM